MFIGFFILVFFQILGELTSWGWGLVIPGPVVGMVYFFFGLVLMPQMKRHVQELSRVISSYLALFFVPAGVGIINYFDLFGTYGLLMTVTVLLSTAVTLGVTAMVFVFLLRWTNKGPS